MAVVLIYDFGTEFLFGLGKLILIDLQDGEHNNFFQAQIFMLEFQNISKRFGGVSGAARSFRLALRQKAFTRLSAKTARARVL